MTKVSPIKVGHFDGFSWIRCEGKGTFLNSPAVKDYGEERIRAGEMCLVVDLEACTGMDSTFMGTLAGLANRMTEKEGAVQIADPGEKNKNSLEDLGLDYLLDIDPANPVWEDEKVEAKNVLKNCKSNGDPSESGAHVLSAHQTLIKANEGNEEKFSGLVDMLGKELASKARRK